MPDVRAQRISDDRWLGCSTPMITERTGVGIAGAAAGVAGVGGNRANDGMACVSGKCGDEECMRELWALWRYPAWAALPGVVLTHSSGWADGHGAGRCAGKRGRV